MAQDHQEDSSIAGSSRPRRIVLAGIVVATTLGAGLGLWARPAPLPEQADAPAPVAPPLPAAIEIVVDDTPAPIGPLLEVLPAEMAAAAAIVPAARQAATAQVQPDAEPLPVIVLRPKAPPTVVAKTRTPARKPDPAAKSKDRAQVKLAAANGAGAKPKAERTTGPKTAAKPKENRKLAKATAKPGLKAKAKVAEAKPAKPRPGKAPTKSGKEAPPKRLAKMTPAPKPSTAAPRRNACDLHDPGAALVCADQRLGVRDRQLQRAYRRAEAAGVPSSALRRQQARWLEARAAAAREAPWAVEDVYVARISEINDMIRDAREN